MKKQTRKEYWNMLVDRLKYKRLATRKAKALDVAFFESQDAVYIYVFVLNDMREDFILLKTYFDFVKLLDAIEEKGDKMEFVREYFDNKKKGEMK